MAREGLNIDEFEQVLEKALERTTRRLPGIGAANAITAKSLIQNRIQQRGQNAQGGRLGEYSDTELPAFFFKGKENNAAGRSFVQQAIEQGRMISYKDFRAAHGYPADYIDLTFTGRMWASIGIVQRRISPDAVKLVIAASDDESDKKLFYNSVRFGDILEMSELEISQIEDSIADEISREFERQLNR